MKFRTISALIAAVAIAFSISCEAFADKIALVDLEKIIQESTAISSIQKKIEKKKSEYEVELEKKQKELVAEQKRIESKKDELSKESLEKEVKKFEKKEDELKTLADKRQNSLKKALTDGMNKINEKMRAVIADIAKENQIDIVLQTNQTFYSKDSADITNEVLSTLNKKLPKVDVKFD